MPGAVATVRVPEIPRRTFPGTVTRIADALQPGTRTLLTEIDIKNPELPKGGRRLRPGMYAYATVTAELPDVLTLPASAVVIEGDVNVGFKSFSYFVEEGHLKRAQIQVGARNDQLVQVLQKQAVPVSAGGQPR